MKQTCRSCAHVNIWVEGEYQGSYFSPYCLLTGKKVNLLMAGCLLHLTNPERAARQQAQNESWRPGTSVPLAIPK